MCFDGDNALRGLLAEFDDAAVDSGARFRDGSGRFIGRQARTKLFELRLDRGVSLIACGELLHAKRQEFEPLAIQRVAQLSTAFAGVFEALFVELERVGVCFDSDL